MATKSSEFPYGLIAGGMIDGSIHVWDSGKLVQGSAESLLATVQQHQGAIHGLQFNPHKESSHLLASGGGDGEVFVMALDRPDAPNVFVPAPPPSTSKHSADITKVSWNSQVAHIVASASQNGSTIVWDLRQKKAWCELREPTGSCVSDVAWNPDQGLHLVTASGDDKNPVIKLWDLRSSTSLPLATLTGHTEGVLSVSWCPADSSLLMSCAKDNQTLLWDLFHLKPVFDLPSERVRDVGVGLGMGEQAGFGGLASSAVQKRFHVSWSPCLPAVVAACSFDRRVQFYSLTGARSRIGRAPKWLRRPVSAAFGFGGNLTFFNNKAAVEGVQASPVVQLMKKEEDPAVGEACDRFHAALASGDFKGFCDAKAGDASLGEQDRRVWSLMRVICFEKNAREELLTHLGFDNGAIAVSADEYVRSRRTDAALPPPPPPPPPPVFAAGSPSKALAMSQTDPADAETLFGAPPVEPPVVTAPPPPPPASPAPKQLSPVVAALAQEMAVAAMAGMEAEPTIRQALVVGNFAAAVECCLEAGLMAEALLLAQCGDPALCSRTQAMFFQRQKDRKPFLQILHAIIKGELMEMVQTSDLTRWKETLALLSTYGKSEEFPALCETLAVRLETELGDVACATLCYMCATNVERVVHFWAEELAAANAAKGKLDSAALQQFVEKVVVYTHANPVDSLGAECGVCFSQYAALLASQGRLDVAHKYLRGHSAEEAVLRDRIFHGTTTHPAGTKPPPFPFSRVEVRETQPQVQPQVQPQTQTQAASVANKLASAAGPAKVASTVQTPQAVAGGGAPQLPPGWTRLVDPASGRPYYVNQGTGTSQWEPPAPAPTPTPVATPATTMPASSPSHPVKPSPYVPAARPISAAGPSPGPMPTPMATPMAESSAVPVWTPTAAATRPTAPAQPTPTPAPKPVVPLIELPSVAALEAIVASLSASAALSPADRRQLGMVSSSLCVLRGKAGAGEVAVEVQELLDQLLAALQGRNFAAANAVQTVLANTAWQQHKDWIKGVKVLIQVLSNASKK